MSYDYKSMSPEELKQAMTKMGEKPFRAKQVFDWIHVRLARSFEEMDNLPKALRAKLAANGSLTVLDQVDRQISQIDGTRKYLFGLQDGNVVESVLMRYEHGNSVCISSQVGCKMGCRFCASTIDGWLRNLTPAEMLDQIYSIARDTGERINHLVVMGTGEPLDNYDNLLTFIRLLSDEKGYLISQRNMTVSTCGLVPRIRDLAAEKLQITLALSLHASSQKKRRELMPVADTYGIEETIDACRCYFRETGRRITFEYSLVAGVNDSAADAERLAAMLGNMNCHINLIPVNPIKERSYSAPSHGAALAFLKQLEKKGINVTIRREMGRDIDGACGQLRRKHISKTKAEQEQSKCGHTD